MSQSVAQGQASSHQDQGGDEVAVNGDGGDVVAIPPGLPALEPFQDPKSIHLRFVCGRGADDVWREKEADCKFLWNNRNDPNVIKVCIEAILTKRKCNPVVDSFGYKVGREPKVIIDDFEILEDVPWNSSKLRFIVSCSRIPKASRAQHQQQQQQQQQQQAPSSKNSKISDKKKVDNGIKAGGESWLEFVNGLSHDDPHKHDLLEFSKDPSTPNSIGVMIVCFLSLHVCINTNYISFLDL